MRLYGLTESEVEKVRSIFARVFPKGARTQVYIFGSRARGEHRKYSDVDLIVESTSKTLQKQLEKVESKLEDSDLPYKFDLVRSDKVIPSFRKNINKDKTLFWSTDSKLLKNKWRKCPIGQHWVRNHKRTLKSGTVVDRDGHCRNNPSHKELITGDELETIHQSEKFGAVKVMPKGKSLGFESGKKYDRLIGGWVSFWNDTIGKPKGIKKLHPNVIKALIASESGFREKAVTSNRSKKIGKARGLAQITEQTWRILKNQKGELKDYFVILKKADLLDPSKNIAAAVRWLFRKYETAKNRLGREPSWEEVLWEYKGITKQTGKKALEIKNNLRSYLKELR